MIIYVDTDMLIEILSHLRRYLRKNIYQMCLTYFFSAQTYARIFYSLKKIANYNHLGIVND